MRKLIDWFKRKQDIILFYLASLSVWVMLTVFIESYKQIVEEALIDTYHYYNDIVIAPHPIIRNYKNIVYKEEYFKIDIIKVDELNGQELVGYIKTFWIKIIQRRWKYIFKERQKIRKARSLPKSLYERQLTGKWPKHLNILPRFTLNLKN